MATVRIREYARVAIPIPGQIVQIAFDDDAAIDQTPITLSGSSQQSAAFNLQTSFIIITSDGIFSYKVGNNPTVTTNMVRFPADTVLYVGVRPGDKVAVITNT